MHLEDITNVTEFLDDDITRFKFIYPEYDFKPSLLNHEINTIEIEQLLNIENEEFNLSLFNLNSPKCVSPIQTTQINSSKLCESFYIFELSSNDLNHLTQLIELYKIESIDQLVRYKSKLNTYYLIIYN